ncbi:glycosyltransferase family 2 protein [Flavobacterium sp. RHBU_24]|uniref:glycosyltransferase family 2 protein n=1 Tax=Flavobacterium sp. RHBU_24 TaxID=3391185 RepID=UPI003984AB52
MLSVLVPAYNYDVTPLVQAVHTQCLKAGIDFEIIVADDSPGSPLCIKNSGITVWSHCRFIQNKVNLGRTLTRKKLAEAAVYTTLLFLDADVMPADGAFITRYLPFINKGNTVVMGGYAYKQESGQPALRLKYGRAREEKAAAERNKKPYTSVFSGNFLTSKHVFLQNNYPENRNFYGMDNYFSYSLYKNKVAVVHIDNPIYHLGLEEDTVFFAKCLESVRIRKELLADKEGIENINPLLRYYRQLGKYRLRGVVAVAFRLFEPLLKKRIMNKNHDLFCLDLYRLGYLCTIS